MMDNEGGQINILILDDNNHNLDLVSSLLSEDLFSKSLVKTGAAAIRVAQRIKFSLAILDINLPDKNGLDVAKEIKEIQPECEIIFCSAYSDASIREKAFLAGGIDYIEKPFEIVTTRQRIKNQTDKLILQESLRSEKQRLEKMISSMVEGVVTTNLEDDIISFNSAAEKIFKVTANEVLGSKFSQFIPPALRKRHASALKNFKEGRSVGIIGSRKPTQLTAVTATGQIISVELTLSTWEERQSKFVTAIIRDVSRQKLIESSLTELSNALNDTDSMVARYSRDLDDFVWMTDHFSTLLETVEVSSSIDQIIQNSFAGCQDAGKISQSLEIETLNQQGSFASYLVQVLPAKNLQELVIFVTETSKLTSLKRRADALLNTVRTDELTGCYSRRAFFEDFEDGRRVNAYTIALFDIDYFKSINDSYGHDIGDLYLQKLINSLTENLGDGEFLARLGGEEFVLVIPTSSHKLEYEYFERFRRQIAEFNLLAGGRSISRSASFGVSRLRQEDNIKKSMAIADEGLQRAKSEGRNRVIYTADNVEDSVFRRVRRPSHEDIISAFNSSNVYYDYQKIYDALKNETVGYEALLRMRDADNRIIPPNYFLDEYYHLSNNYAENMSRAALFRSHLDELSKSDFDWVSYNIRGSDLIGRNLSELIEICSPESCGVQVCLELSEEEISDRIDLPALTNALEVLKRSGFKIYLDDFGKERSNFHRLVELPFDVIKLDRALIKGLGVTAKAEKLISFLTGLTEDFDMQIVAEGVETESQARILVDNNLYLHQGFYYGRPGVIR